MAVAYYTLTKAGDAQAICTLFEAEANITSCTVVGTVGETATDPLISDQAQITTLIINELAEKQSSPLRVLDVGGGHGQNVQVVLNGGHSLTVLGSDTACGSLLENVTSERFTFITGDMTALPFNDGDFDLVLSYRMMAHIDDWRHFAKELQRVSKSWVVIAMPLPRP